MAAKQQTLKAPISFSGTGLHTGVKVTMTVHPAPENSGIVFRRIDLEGKPEIPALCDYVTDTSRGTTIEKGWRTRCDHRTYHVGPLDPGRGQRHDRCRCR